MRWASSVGSASASSKQLRAMLWTPPVTAASVWMAARTMLFSGCCAMSVLPPVCVCVRSIIERGFSAP